MQGHDFVYCITDRNGTNPQFWGIDANGKAKLSAKPSLLEFSPDGWLDIAIQNVRNRRYWAVDRMVTIPFNYVEDGACILKTIFHTRGPETPAFLKVCRLTLDYDPPPNGTLEFVTGQSPLTANATATGTITGTAATTVLIRMNLTVPDVNDSITGTFDTLSFTVDYANPLQTLSVIIPAGGVINFSVTFNQAPGSGSAAAMDLVNEAGNTSGSYGYWYKQIYCGQIDLSSYNHKGAKVTVTTLEDGLPKYLKANENTTLELPMNVPEAIFWKADGIVLKNRATFLVGDGQGTATGNRNHVVNLDLVAKEFEAIGDVSDTKRINVTVPGDLAGTQQHFHKAAIDETVVINYDFQLDVFYDPPSPSLNPGAELYTQIAHVNAAGTVVSSDTILHKTFIQGIPGSHKLAGTITTPVLAGHRLFLWTYCTVFGPAGDGQLYFVYTANTDTGNQSFIVDYKSRFATTYIRALRPQYIWEKLIKSMTEGTYQADAGDGITNYFGTSNHFNKPLTCGNAIRGFDDAVMKISPASFFQFWDSFDAVGISGTQDYKVKFDRKKNLINFNSSISLGDVSDMADSFDKSFAFNELEIGYPEIKNEAGMLNGNDAFNCKYLWSTGSTLFPAKLDKVSKAIKTDCYEIEMIRISLAGKVSTDYKNDNTLYGVHILNTLVPGSGGIPDHYELDRTLNPYVTGVSEPESIFNVEFTPKRNLLRNGDFLRSSFYLSDWKTLEYREADKNNKLITTIGLNTIEEKANVNIGSLAAPFFLPVLLEFNAIAPFELLELLDADPLQIFDWDFYGTNYKGIMVKVGIAPGSQKEQAYQMLSAPDNDLKKLIDYYG